MTLFKKSGNYLVKIIDDIIDISKIEAGQIQISHSQVIIKDVFNKLFIYIDQQRIYMNKEDVKIEYQVIPGNLTVKTDPVRLKQILLNLLTNALKFTESGMVKYIGYLNDKKVTFMVIDTGIGIEPDDQSRIFDRFSKIIKNTDKIYPGTGIGLSISKSLVELLGGEIRFKSIPGETTEFTFSLPWETE